MTAGTVASGEDCDVIDAFSRDLASRITGLKPRQLDYLETAGVVVPTAAPPKEGFEPLYSFRDMLKLKVAAEMWKRDVKRTRIADLVRELEEMGHAEPLATLTFYGDPGDDKGRVFWQLPGQDRPYSGRRPEQSAETFDLTLQDLRTDLEGTIEDLTRRTPGTIERIRGVQGGQAVVGGTRVPVDLIRRMSRRGWNERRILRALPHLEPEDVRAALEPRATEGIELRTA